MMPLIQLWEKTPDIVLQYNIKQIISASGDGILADGSECSKELRYYLRNIPEPKLFEHTQYCLDNAFDKSGIVLQDLINEIGYRLDYKVENGIYQGKQNRIGFDGIWESPDTHAIIIETKTTDAYRINLDKIAAYRNKLIETQRISQKSSILIVVGRKDTGDLEAQIRGSRHAWDTRIISVDALMKLLDLKVKSGEDITTEKIRNLLIPFEYTRLDNIIDVVFTAAKDVESANEETTSPDEGASEAEAIPATEYKQNHTPRVILEKSRDDALIALGNQESTHLIAHKRAQFWNSDHSVRAVCPVSKRYPKGDYWYAFHPAQREFLKEGSRSFLLLSCIDHDSTYAIPAKDLEEFLPHLSTTEREDRYYWHLNVHPNILTREYFLMLPRKGAPIALKPYQIPLNLSASKG